ncbi:MAG: hypothetical protein A2Z27_01380 [candidate division Zixibacteria bacterium RBG_16_50_21]|nr:MAG: hypothetical protein A2Z27_01380 [candidate division Zixibacteria bacterium RBG_16_50_21]
MNLNGFPYEIADWVQLYSYLLGLETFSPEAIVQSDVNFDNRPVSMADNLFFLRILVGEAAPLHGQLYPVLFNPYDLLAGQFQKASPGDVVNFPIYFRNFQSAGALSFKVKFDPNQLSLVAVDTAATRVSFWTYDDSAHTEGIYDSVKTGDLNFAFDTGQLFLFAFCQSCTFDNLYSKVVSPGEGMILNLKFQISNSAPANTLLPIEFITEENLGHYNAYANTQDPSRLIIPSVFSAGVYTGLPQSGDVYTDGKLNVVDIVLLVNYIFKGFLPPNPNSLGDLDSDSDIDLADVMLLVNQIY